MKKTIIYLLLVMPATATMAAAQDLRVSRRGGGDRGSSGSTSTEKPSENTPKAKPLDEPFMVLANTSIFARDRRTGQPQPPIEHPVEIAPETYFAFRGAAVENGQVIGFVEDTRDSSTIRVRVGDPLASGKVTNVSIDQLDFERSNGAVKVPVRLGCDLTGREHAPPEVAGNSGSSGNSSPASPSSVDRLGDYFQRQRGFGGPGGFDPNGGGRRFNRDFSGGGGGGGGFGGGGGPGGDRRGRRSDGGGFGG